MIAYRQCQLSVQDWQRPFTWGNVRSRPQNERTSSLLGSWPQTRGSPFFIPGGSGPLWLVWDSILVCKFSLTVLNSANHYPLLHPPLHLFTLVAIDVMRNTSCYLRSEPQKRRFTWGNALSMERKFFVLRSKAAQCAIRRACNVRQLWQSEFAWQPQSSKYKAPQLSATTYIDSSTETPSIGGFHSWSQNFQEALFWCIKISPKRSRD